MKKLMFAVAALAAGVACAEITSANVVGYQTKELGASEFKMIAPTFQNVGGGAVNLTDVKLAAKDGEGIIGWGAEQVQILTAEGNIGDSYFWWNGVNVGGCEADSFWGDESMNPVTDVTISDGCGLIYYGDAAVEVTFAGQVASAKIEVPAISGEFAMVGNCTPVSINLNATMFEAEDEGVIGWGAEQIQTLTAEGNIGDCYFWWNGVNVGGGEADSFWGDESMSPIENVILEAGDAFIIYADANCKFVIPSAL